MFMGPLKHKTLNEFSQETVFHFVILLAYFNRSIMFRSFMLMCAVTNIGWLISRVLTYKQSGEPLIIVIMQLLFTTNMQVLICMICYDREMHSRKNYNEERIMKVETQRIEESIGKLVPSHIIEGIKNDKQIIDKLENVTILFARVRCLNGNPDSLVFSHNYATLLQTLFKNFDMLCDMRQLYKVHSYGDIYVIISYNGKIPKDKRKTNNLIAEAYDTLLMAIDMLETASEVRQKSSFALKEFDLQIGIHSGKILGGLIGQNYVRYDVFG
jgi:hypothetical protein